MGTKKRSRLKKRVANAERALVSLSTMLAGKRPRMRSAVRARIAKLLKGRAPYSPTRLRRMWPLLVDGSVGLE